MNKCGWQPNSHVRNLMGIYLTMCGDATMDAKIEFNLKGTGVFTIHRVVPLMPNQITVLKGTGEILHMKIEVESL